MSILASLVRAYDRLPDAPPFGYSAEKIGFLIALNEDGTVAHVVDLREGEGKKKVPPLLMVPQAVKRTVGIAPNFLWDKTSYVLGVTAGEGKRTSDEHAAFVKRHLEALEGNDDPGLLALARFLNSWTPKRFADLAWSEEMKDQNVVFALEADRLRNIYLHDRPAARTLWAKVSAEGERAAAICLVSGEQAPVARLHPAIKGVWGAQTAGASIVSFNLDAFESYGHEQGDNAPVSEAAAFAYTTVLNRFLNKDSGHRIQIGDASTVFWADGSGAEQAETIFSVLFGGEDTGSDKGVDETSEAGKVGAMLERIRMGQPLSEIDPGLAEGVRFYVLGLAPNAARLSIRFWLEDNFGALIGKYQRFVDDMRIEPGPRDGDPPLWRYLLETAAQGKRENVPPNLAGEWMRAILAGTPYPLTLLSTVLMRMRADKAERTRDSLPLRIAILKAVLVRNFNMAKEAPVALDPRNTNKGYLLGRLFAAYEQVQSAALGRNVNATIKDKFYGAASAQPRKVFAMLESGSANHLSKLGKQSPAYKVTLERVISEIMGLMSPDDDPFPASLSSEQQALFGLGYYHQRSEFFKSRKNDTALTEEATA
jgi:CRISPR-associated protein Csd1